jgi:hypothetical protein
MDKKIRFNSTQEMLNFLKVTRKRNEASRKKANREFEREQKIWKEKERADDLDLEKRKHEAFLKDIRKKIKEQKALVEKVERMMRKSEGSKSLKAKNYIPIRNKSALVTEPTTQYKGKNK